MLPPRSPPAPAAPTSAFRVPRAPVGRVRYKRGMTDPGEQMALVRAEAAGGRARAAGSQPVGRTAESEPVARVIVDVEPAHLDRLWDYTVPAKLDEAAQP